VRAAGALLNKPVDTVIGDVISAAKELIEETSARVSSGGSLT
jgi:hypothetical protein